MVLVNLETARSIMKVVIKVMLINTTHNNQSRLYKIRDCCQNAWIIDNNNSL